MHSSLPSHQGSLNDRCDSFSTFVVVWFDRNLMRCQRCTTRTISCYTLEPLTQRQQTTRRIFMAQPSPFCPPQLLATEVPPLLSAVTFCLNFNSKNHHLPRPATSRPSSVASHASLSVGLVRLLPRTTPFLVMHRTAPVRS